MKVESICEESAKILIAKIAHKAKLMCDAANDRIRINEARENDVSANLSATAKDRSCAIEYAVYLDYWERMAEQLGKSSFAHLELDEEATRTIIKRALEADALLLFAMPYAEAILGDKHEFLEGCWERR